LNRGRGAVLVPPIGTSTVMRLSMVKPPSS
jgi:hypothetical protein